MKRNWSPWRFGGVLVSVLLVVLFSVIFATGGTPNRLLLYAAAALASLVMRLGRPSALAMKHESERPEANDPRYDDGPTAPQLAGSACAACSQKVLGSFDGRFCKDCGAPIHKDCRKEHRATAHTTRTGTYR